MNENMDIRKPSAESFKSALKEMKLMREGKLPKRTWRQCKEEEGYLDDELNSVEENK